MEEKSTQTLKESPEDTEATITEAAPPSPKSNKNKALVAVVTASLVVLVGGVIYKHLGLEEYLAETKTDEGGFFQSVDGPIARVNGEEVSGELFAQQAAQVALGAGITDVANASSEVQEQIQSQVLDTLINTELILQAAEDAGVTATDEEVESAYTEIVEQAGGEEAALARLNELGVSAEEIKENIRDDLMIQAYIDTHVAPGSLEVTEEEIVAFYDQVTQGQENVPPLDEVRFQIEEQLRFGKEQETVLELLQTLRENADIEVLI